MYIICQHCQTKFTILAELLGINGRRVKCSQCQHTWHQKSDHSAIKLSEFDSPKNDSIIPSQKGPQRERNAGLPMLLPPKPKQSYFFSFLCCCAIILVCALLYSKNIHPLLGYKALKIEDIRLNVAKETGNMKLSYTITNPSNEQITIPSTRIRIQKQGALLPNSYVIDNRDLKIYPAQTLETTIEFAKNYDTIEKLDVTIGNRIDLLLK